mgnify:CR=1 FL=1
MHYIIEKLRKCYLIEAKKYLLEKNIEKNIKKLLLRKYTKTAS